MPVRQAATAERMAAFNRDARQLYRNFMMRARGWAPTCIHSAYYRPSTSLPARLALLEEGIDPLFGIAGEHVLRHDLARIGIGRGEILFRLAVERFLADLDGEGRLGRDLARERERGRLQL